jgi:ATP-dependent DNA helicase RecQ
MAMLRGSLGDVEPPACGRCDVCRQTTTHEMAADTGLARNWLAVRPVPIAGAKTNKISPGLSLLDSQLSPSLFIRFMKERAVTEEIDPEILELLFKQAASLPKIGAIAQLPSRTWKAGAKYARALATHFNVPLLTDLFIWMPLPEKRQGELLNNDQRYSNVHEKMAIGKLPPVEVSEAIVLFDDYLGSAATMKEAARALRKTWKTAPLVPLTIATVKWRLGKPGFIAH